MSGVLGRLADVKKDEVRAVVWSWLYLFCVFSAYSVIRPIRDEAGVAGGVDNLPWLFTGTLVAMTLVNPAFAALVARLPRVQFVSRAYRFAALHLLIFFVLLKMSAGAQNIWVGRAFFIWVTVFNLFVVSVFWAFMADAFTREQGKRLFGVIALASTIGAIVGASLTSSLVGVIGAPPLLLASVALLELAVFSVKRLAAIFESLRTARALPPQEQPIGGGVLTGIRNAVGSPYLLNITVFMLLYTILSTFLFFQQTDMVSRSAMDRATRTAFFARIDIIINAVTLTMQLFVTGRLMRWLGVALTLTILPALSAVGFLTFALNPTLNTVVWFQILRRAGNFAVARPAREVLFTVLSREDKYKSKNFIDTFTYRAGDQIGSWSYALLGMAGIGIVGSAWVAVPLSLVWLANAWWLGRKQEQLATEPLPASTASLRTAPGRT